MQSAETELQNTIELRATASEIAARQPDLRAKTKRRFWSTFSNGNLKGKSAAPELRKSADKSISQPYIWSPAAKDKKHYDAAAAPSNLDAAITGRSAEPEPQNAIELRARTSDSAARKSVAKRIPCEASLKSDSWRCENEAFVRDFLQILKDQVVKMTPELEVPWRRSEHDPGTAGSVWEKIVWKLCLWHDGMMICMVENIWKNNKN